MTKLLIAMLAATVLWLVNAAESTWLTDLPKAQAQAKAENKIVLMDFTGSDWCGWCIKFHKEVLDTPEFQAYAAKNVELVERSTANLPATISRNRKSAPAGVGARSRLIFWGSTNAMVALVVSPTMKTGVVMEIFSAAEFFPPM